MRVIGTRERFITRGPQFETSAVQHLDLSNYLSTMSDRGHRGIRVHPGRSDPGFGRGPGGPGFGRGHAGPALRGRRGGPGFDRGRGGFGFDRGRGRPLLFGGRGGPRIDRDRGGLTSFGRGHG